MNHAGPIERPQGRTAFPHRQLFPIVVTSFVDFRPGQAFVFFRRTTKRSKPQLSSAVDAHYCRLIPQLEDFHFGLPLRRAEERKYGVKALLGWVCATTGGGREAITIRPRR